MADIVERLRHWSHGLTYDPAVGLMHDAAAEIERLRRAICCLAEQDATVSVCEGRVTVTMDATLTVEEREAIEVAAAAYAADFGEQFAAVLRHLLERLN